MLTDEHLYSILDQLNFVDRDFVQTKVDGVISGTIRDLNYTEFRAAITANDILNIDILDAPNKITLTQTEEIDDFWCDVKYEFTPSDLGVAVEVYIDSVTYITPDAKNVLLPTLALAKALDQQITLDSYPDQILV